MMLAMSWVVAGAALWTLLVMTLRGAANAIEIGGKTRFSRVTRAAEMNPAKSFLTKWMYWYANGDT